MDTSRYEGALLTEDEAQIDLEDLLGSHIDILDSPMKKPVDVISSAMPQKLALDNPKVYLPPAAHHDLFQVTNEKYSQKNDIFGVEESFYNQHLNNDKIDKMMRNLEDDQFDFELDDQGRTRIFRGRFKNFTVDQDDGFDQQMGGFLSNKENHHEPVKRTLHDGRIRKPGNVLKTKKNNITPILKPLNNLTNIELKRAEQPTYNDAAKRVCKPKHRIIKQIPRSSMVQNHSGFIYWVDSSTGSVNDATQFGTELNASNCEGFPLPEDVNEIVQIPTNDDSGKSKKSKSAIIKAFRNEVAPAQECDLRTGFYSRHEYSQYLKTVPISQQGDSGVEVSGGTSEPVMIPGSQHSKKLRFADNLEW